MALASAWFEGCPKFVCILAKNCNLSSSSVVRISGSDSNSHGHVVSDFDSRRDQTLSNKVGFHSLRRQQQGTPASCIHLKFRSFLDSSPRVLLLLDDTHFSRRTIWFNGRGRNIGTTELIVNVENTPRAKGLVGTIVANWMRTCDATSIRRNRADETMKWVFIMMCRSSDNFPDTILHLRQQRELIKTVQLLDNGPRVLLARRRHFLDSSLCANGLQFTSRRRQFQTVGRSQKIINKNKCFEATLKPI